EYNHKAVSIALEACPETGYVAGDIGPSGAFLPPVGNINIIELESNYMEQTQILADAGVDLFFIETMVDLKEAEAAVKAAKSVSKLPVFVSMTYKKTKRGFFTIMGNSIEQCVDSLQKLGVDAIGANCTIGSDDMIDLIKELNQLTELPIIAKPNAGLPKLINGETIYPTKSKEFAKDISKIVENNARIVGGCCGTDPKFIEKIAQTVRGN
ncbi:MAG: homocysteine S-methyltransferase family protein, partial [Candidatus Heimdallarchaeaceae archaeon]